MQKEYTKKDDEYVFIKCPHCKVELRFKREPRFRRVYGRCKHCNKDFEIIVK
ncbi:MAG: phage terminase large subunit family protein [Acholeplasmatales bacterium]|nr:phage terminase large subunit family protein [Acholeplasmatales bacterium]